MNKNLTQLIAIAQIDKEADALDPVMQDKQSVLDKLLAQKAKQEARLRALDEMQEEARLTIARNEGIIQANSQKIEDIQQRLVEPRSDREARTLSIEEDLSKEQIRHSNNEITRLNKELESRDAQISEINSEIETLKTSIQTTKEICEKEISQIKAQQQEIFKKKEVFIAAIDKKVITFYEKIRRWAKNTSVVPVKKQACGGCFIRLNDKLYSDILQSSEIISCPHCGRILYITQDSALPESQNGTEKMPKPPKTEHSFSFEGGDILSKMGASWFVSYAYYEKVDKTHENWDKISTAKSRINRYEKSKEFHTKWLKEILSMSDANLSKNEIGLDANSVKNMAQALLG